MELDSISIELLHSTSIELLHSASIELLHSIVPIELNELGDPIELNELGDPIELNELGDPMELNELGDPMELNELGDPIETGELIAEVCSISMGFELEFGSGSYLTGSEFSGTRFMLVKMAFVSLVIRQTKFRICTFFEHTGYVYSRLAMPFKAS